MPDDRDQVIARITLQNDGRPQEFSPIPQALRSLTPADHLALCPPLAELVERVDRCAQSEWADPQDVYETLDRIKADPSMQEHDG